MALIPLTDAMFLFGESRDQPMHVGGLQLFQLPEGAGPKWLRDLYDRLLEEDDLAAVFRRRAARSARTLGALSWVEERDVDLSYHVRHSALPQPGRVRELLELTSRLHGGLLDRHRPLWEFHLVEGVAGGRFATYTKLHHALMDGVSAMKLLEASLSPAPEGEVTAPWVRRPRRERRRSAASPGAPLRALADLGVMGPVAAWRAIEALRDQSVEFPLTAPKTILNVPVTGSRRYAAQSWPLEDLRTVAKASGTTINDVVMAMCAGALRRYLIGLDALPDAPLVAMAPVSLRGRGGDGDGGNAVGAVLCNLGTDLDDPLDRLETVHTSMAAAKRSLSGLSQVQVLALSAAMVSPSILAMVPGVRRVLPPAFNVIISNVPGPKQPLYLGGARLDGTYPVSIPFSGQALNITVTSYDTTMAFGLTGCRRHAPHLQRMLGHLDTSLEELLAETA